MSGEGLRGLSRPGVLLLVVAGRSCAHRHIPDFRRVRLTGFCTLSLCAGEGESPGPSASLRFLGRGSCTGRLGLILSCPPYDPGPLRRCCRLQHRLSGMQPSLVSSSSRTTFFFICCYACCGRTVVLHCQRVPRELARYPGSIVCEESGSCMFDFEGRDI